MNTKPSTSLGRWGLTLVAAAALAGCSALEETKVDYRSAQRGNTLEVPPDLTQISREGRYDSGSDVVSAKGFQAANAQSANVPVAANAVGDVRMERAGNQRWLVVQRAPEALWEDLRQFWKDNGFVLQVDQPDLGILETDWAENRAKIPQDVIRRTIGKLVDGLYDTGLRDRFRTRVERNAQGQTEIFVSHRGMEEVFASAAKDRTVWQPRASDLELETEFLRRLMLKLGGSEGSATAAVKEAPALAKVGTANGAPVVDVQDGLERTWRRLGLALDRSGFTVEDRDKSQGVYFVRYVETQGEESKTGFFGRLFGGGQTPKGPQKLRIVVQGDKDKSTVSVLNADGQPERSETAQRIVKQLADELK